MASIHTLDPSLVNKIAAGEVIERPASVVKELVENALDAGASRIDVTLEDGGATLIAVTDDGHGIPPDELPLAVAPHATSKIASADDLFNIRTLGFRGEALASIASVSRFRILSRTADRLEGGEIRFSEDGAVPAVNLAAAPVGTTVEVRHLFYNVPARRKFLRQPATELAHVTEQFARLALAHPRIRFTLAHNGRSLRSLPPTDDRRTRIADFYGPELAACLWSIRRNERGLSIDALLAPPTEARASSKWQYVFLNGRHIQDRRIAFAIREAYRSLVEHDRSPVVFLFLTAPCDAYDVNVHPTKIEVRWRDAGLVQSQVLAVLRETLLSHDLTPRLALRGPSTTGDRFAEGATNASPGPLDASAEHEQRRRQALADFLKSIDPTQARLGFAPPALSHANVRPSIGTTLPPPMADTRDAPQRAADGALESTRAGTSDTGDPSTRLGEETSPPVTTPVGSSSPAAAMLGSVASVLQVHNTYLVAETSEGIVIIDQHALHERILYERFRERILSGSLEAQRLLLPATLQTSPARLQALEDCGQLLHRLGIDVSAFGPATLAVQSFPTLLPHVDAASFVADLLDRLAESCRTQGATGPGAEESLIHQALDMMACKAAVKAGDPLTAEEMQALLAQRHLIQRSSNCPHGRPTTLELSTRDLERQFKRI